MSETREIKATQISLGHGLVDIGPIHFNGRRGLLLRPREKHIPVGEPGELQNAEYWPSEGDVVLWLDKPGGEQVVIEELTALSRASDGEG